MVDGQMPYQNSPPVDSPLPPPMPLPIEVPQSEVLPVQPPPPTHSLRVWPVFVAWVSGFAVLILVWIVAFTVWFVVQGARGISVKDAQAHTQAVLKEPLFLIPLMAAISLGNGAIALCGGLFSPLKVKRRLALNPGTAGWGALVLMSIGTFTAGIVGMNVVELIGIHTNQGSEQTLMDMARNSSPIEYATLLFVVSVFPAVCEELLFRGYAQTRLIARWGPVAGIATATLMFAIAHLDLVQSLGMLFIGSYLGWTAYRTGSTRTSMVCHLVNNAAALGFSIIPEKLFDPKEPASHGEVLIGIAIGSVICTVCTWSANRLIPKRK